MSCVRIRDVIGGGIIPWPRPIPCPPGGNDNTPNAVNWSNIVFNVADDFGDITSQQITGISSSITLKVEDVSTSPNTEVYYRVDSSQQTGSVFGKPTSPWAKLAETAPYTTFNVNNNQWVSFACWGDSKVSADTLTVVNTSDGNATLDTFTVQSNP